MGLRASLGATAGVMGAALLLAGCAPSAVVSTVCTYSNSTVVSQSKAGQSANAGLKALAAKVQARLQADGKKVDSHGSTAVSQFNVEKNVLNARLQYTRAAVSQRIDGIVKPLIEKAYVANHCTVLLDAGAVLKKGDTTDLDADVLKSLDAKVKTVSFDLLQLPQPQPPQSAPAASTTAVAPAHQSSSKAKVDKPRGHEKKR
ncbi:MAG TPA: hypothetical protein VFQ88_09690 [Nevskiaceae bacterium]|nr:hypothetical protein [Nevskiaceae bacterium]